MEGVHELDVVGVRVEMPTNQPLVLLREVEGTRYLPIWIGAVEATAIAFAQQGVVPPRPLTHDLIKSILEGTKVTLRRVRITGLERQTYLAALVLDQEGREIEIDSRPSDAIALALRFACPILVHRTLLEGAAAFEREVQAFAFGPAEQAASVQVGNDAIVQPRFELAAPGGEMEIEQAEPIDRPQRDRA